MIPPPTSSNLSPTWIPAFSDAPPLMTLEIKIPWKEINALANVLKAFKKKKFKMNV